MALQEVHQVIGLGRIRAGLALAVDDEQGRAAVQLQVFFVQFLQRCGGHLPVLLLLVLQGAGRELLQAQAGVGAFQLLHHADAVEGAGRAGGQEDPMVLGQVDLFAHPDAGLVAHRQRARQGHREHAVARVVHAVVHTALMRRAQMALDIQQAVAAGQIHELHGGHEQELAGVVVLLSLQEVDVAALFGGIGAGASGQQQRQQ